jgi:hypothetical protein
VARMDRKYPQQERGQVPPGHSVSCHRLFGWCAACPGFLLSDEVVAWRSWASARVIGAMTFDAPQAATMAGCTCSGSRTMHRPSCGLFDGTKEAFDEALADSDRRAQAFSAGLTAYRERLMAPWPDSPQTSDLPDLYVPVDDD